MDGAVPPESDQQFGAVHVEVVLYERRYYNFLAASSIHWDGDMMSWAWVTFIDVDLPVFSRVKVGFW